MRWVCLFILLLLAHFFVVASPSASLDDVSIIGENIRRISLFPESREIIGHPGQTIEFDFFVNRNVSINNRVLSKNESSNLTFSYEIVFPEEYLSACGYSSQEAKSWVLTNRSEYGIRASRKGYYFSRKVILDIPSDIQPCEFRTRVLLWEEGRPYATDVMRINVEYSFFQKVFMWFRGLF